MSDKQQSAFPHPKDGGVWGSDPVPGMTMLDAFAIASLPSLLNSLYTGDNTWMPEIAKEAYKMADFMMAEREKK
jgi:hypothetical protein